MRLKSNDDNLEKVGTGDAKGFELQSSSKAFEILSSKIYKNKILAIIRELSSNALDSHIEAGIQDTPFDVHLPTHLSKVFSVRDYGISMSHDELVNLYTTYFSSTKDNSNEYVGALGLGSKSPFCYTDNFTVTRYKDNIKETFVAVIENGIPTINHISTDETSEHDGIEVSVPVLNEADISKFFQEAIKVYRHYDVIPNFLNNKESIKDIQKISYDISGSFWGAKSVKSFYSPSRRFSFKAIQGKVEYPAEIDLENADNTPENYLIKKLLKTFDVYLYFDIGELSIAASREELSYDDYTKNKVIEKVQSFVYDFLYRIYEKINSLDFFHAKYYYSDICSKLIGMNSIVVGTDTLIRSYFKHEKSGYYIFSTELICFDEVFGHFNNKSLYHPGKTFKPEKTIRNSYQLVYDENNNKVVDIINTGMSNFSLVSTQERYLSYSLSNKTNVTFVLSYGVYKNLNGFIKSYLEDKSNKYGNDNEEVYKLHFDSKNSFTITPEEFENIKNYLKALNFNVLDSNDIRNYRTFKNKTSNTDIKIKNDSFRIININSLSPRAGHHYLKNSSSKNEKLSNLSNDCTLVAISCKDDKLTDKLYQYDASQKPKLAIDFISKTINTEILGLTSNVYLIFVPYKKSSIMKHDNRIIHIDDFIEKLKQENKLINDACKALQNYSLRSITDNNFSMLYNYDFDLNNFRKLKHHIDFLIRFKREFSDNVKDKNTVYTKLKDFLEALEKYECLFERKNYKNLIDFSELIDEINEKYPLIFGIYKKSMSGYLSKSKTSKDHLSDKSNSVEQKDINDYIKAMNHYFYKHQT